MSVYVGFKIGKAIERKAYISEYYCGGCGWPVSDHDSYCPECGGAFRKEDATEHTCKQVLTECNDGLMPPFTAHCSECGTQWGYTPNYCPNCGAKVVK